MACVYTKVHIERTVLTTGAIETEEYQPVEYQIPTVSICNIKYGHSQQVFDFVFVSRLL